MKRVVPAVAKRQAEYLAGRLCAREALHQLAKDLRRIYTAPSVEAAWAAFEELE